MRFSVRSFGCALFNFGGNFMSKFKHAISVILCIILLLGSVGIGGSGFTQILTTVVNAEDATSGTCGENLTWSYDASTRTLTISGTGEMDSFSNSSPWSSYNDSIKTVIINNGVTSIGRIAFFRCTSLCDITIPNCVTSIGDSAFSDCTALTSITIPDSVTSIGQWAFYNCSALASAEIGNGVISIENYAFNGCVGLSELKIGNSVTNIGIDAFKGCSAGLEIIVVNDKNTVYHSSGNCLIETEEKRLILGCKNSIIPDDGSVIGIESGAFYNCAGLTNINIPESIKYVIGSSAFRGCTGLTSISIPNASGIGAYAFYECTDLKSVKISNKVYVIENNAFNGCTGLTDVYYDGSEEEWNTTEINGTIILEGNDDLLNATIHFLGEEAPAEPVNPTSSAKLNVRSSATVDYKSNVTITATATGIPDGYVLALYDGNTKISSGDNAKISHNVGTMTASQTYTIKVVDGNGNVQKDGDGNDLTANCEVKVKNSFFDIIIAFFRGLFGLLPNVDIKP